MNIDHDVHCPDDVSFTVDTQPREDEMERSSLSIESAARTRSFMIDAASGRYISEGCPIAGGL